MRLISLNTWCGKIFEPFLEFIKSNSDKTDVFCLQEVMDNWQGLEKENRLTLLNDLKLALPKYNCYFAPFISNHFGNVMFIKKTYQVTEHGDEFVQRWKDAQLENDGTEQDYVEKLGRNIQYVTFSVNGKNLTVLNFHGLWTKGSGKADTPERLEQSRKIIEVLNRIPGPKILCGDFNLMPDTQSIKMIEDTGMIDLIKTTGIKTTRAVIYTAKNNKPAFADYTLVSPEVKVINFEVPLLGISDHLPMILDFEIK